MNCPICKSNTYRLIIDINLKYVNCNQCNAIFQIPLEIDTNIYERLDYFDEHAYLKDIYDRDRLSKGKFYKRFKFIKRFVRKNNKILEIGSGQSILVKYFIDNGFDANGSEISKVWINKVKRDLKINLLTPLKIKKNQLKFDFIILYDVLEHTNEPLTFIKYVKSILKKNGLIFISTPNCGDLFSKIYGPRYEYLSFYEHPILYSKKALTTLFKNSNLKFKFIKHSDFAKLNLYNLAKLTSKLIPLDLMIFGIKTNEIKKLKYNKIYFEKDIWVICKK